MTRTSAIGRVAAGAGEADALNKNCFCLTLDRAALCAALERESGDPDFCRAYVGAESNLLSNLPVFLPKSSTSGMLDVVSAIQEVSQIPAYRDLVLSWAPEIATRDPGPRGAFMGYDFHLTEEGPKLIEINTNAGGAFLNNLLAKAQIACCRQMEPPVSFMPTNDFAARVVGMFEAEWRLQRAQGPLRRIAIVDDVPEEQYLYPEFVLARQMLRKAGYEAFISPPEALQFSGKHLLHDGSPVDLVYNRLVDFSLDLPEHEALRAAYETGAVVLTPNPHNHALFADKRNLVVLSDPARLQELGVPAQLQRLLRAVPRTWILGSGNAADLWASRKELFFKPMRGYGSKAVYRGDKITRGVFEEIARAGYVAQVFAPPGVRMMRVEGMTTSRKVDVRIYAYLGEVLITAARVYQGQATNFRTPGGGFAPVFAV